MGNIIHIADYLKRKEESRAKMVAGTKAYIKKLLEDNKFDMEIRMDPRFNSERLQKYLNP